MKLQLLQEWFYDELELHELEALEDPDPDSDYDYEESYSKRRKKRGNAKGRSSTANSENPPAKRGRSGVCRDSDLDFYYIYFMCSITSMYSVIKSSPYKKVDYNLFA